MFGSGVRTVGIVVMKEPPQMAVRGYHQGLLRACYVAAAGAATPGSVALRIATATAQAIGSAFWASALPGQFVDFFTLSAIAGRSVLLVRLLYSFFLLPFTSFLCFLSLVFLRGKRSGYCSTILLGVLFSGFWVGRTA